MGEGAAPKLFIVRRCQIGDEAPCQMMGRGPVDPRIEGTFGNRDDAEAFRRQRERAARLSRRDHGLFWSQAYHTPTLFELTNFDPPIFLDWLEDADILRPEATNALGWRRWWERVCNHLTQRQRDHLFTGLHKFNFYEILEIDWYDGTDIPPEELEPLPDEADLANAEFDNWHNDIPWDESDPPDSEPDRFDEIPF